MREIRGERLQGITESASSTLFWPDHQPRCSPVETDARGPIVADGTGGERIQILPERLRSKKRPRRGQGGENRARVRGKEKKSGRLVGAAETSKELAEWRRLQEKCLSILGLLKRKEWFLCHKMSSWQ